MTADCVFCRIVAGTEPSRRVALWPDAIAIMPLNPVTPGHTLVLPRRHVPHAATDPTLTAEVMRCAATITRGEANLITSIGPAATQTIDHLHIHIVPRKPGDGLALPWSSGAT